MFAPAAGVAVVKITVTALPFSSRIEYLPTSSAVCVTPSSDTTTLPTTPTSVSVNSKVLGSPELLVMVRVITEGAEISSSPQPLA